MKNKKRWCMFLVVFALMLVSCQVYAADGRLGSIVDGSVLTDKTIVEGNTESGSGARGTYLASGSGKLVLNGGRSVNMSGDTSCNRVSDEVKVTLYLQRLVGTSWSTVYTLGPKTATNAYYVSNSKNYTVTGGYYYRVKGTHSAKKGTTTESTSSYTDGVWID